MSVLARPGDSLFITALEPLGSTCEEIEDALRSILRLGVSLYRGRRKRDEKLWFAPDDLREAEQHRIQVPPRQLPRLLRGMGQLREDWTLPDGNLINAIPPNSTHARFDYIDAAMRTKYGTGWRRMFPWPAWRDIPIAVPFHEKDKVKALGARWYVFGRRWYVPKGIDLNKFDRWLPDIDKWAQKPGSIPPVLPYFYVRKTPPPGWGGRNDLTEGLEE
ncbi:hypothetical protein G3N95_36975 [Paraburkholderia sp. Tr-20389]|uniref:DUF5710 domain-containing protein n=1 Tax=Paraburkholderia sp. Tr-20389 TaxID=2703903 RepID=UPI00197D0CC5|nr:DUF5710 domain-containing protein [Paraburkholderia sp. Tr-20389]MBN3758553.1 hypothetical protein [Paraburkholderia sp. Tr-20389]